MRNTCSNCTTENHDDARFCKHCGTALTQAAAPSTIATATAPTTAATPISDAALFSPPPGQRFPLWLVFLLITGVMLAVGTGWWLYTHYAHSAATTQTQKEGVAKDRNATPEKPASSGNQRKPGQPSGAGAKNTGVQPGKQTAQGLCADRTNFVTRDFCMARLCHQSEHQGEEACVKILQLEEAHRNQPAG